MSFRDSFDEWVMQVLPTRRERQVFAFLVVSILVTARYEKVILPATVGLPAARALIDKGDELAQTQRRVAEYKAATEYFGGDRGKEFARRLLYNESRRGEHRAHLIPQDVPTKQSRSDRVKAWVTKREARAGEAVRYKLRVGERLFRDPPRPAQPAATPPVSEAHKQDLLRRVIGQQSAPQPTTAKPDTDPNRSH